MSYINGFGYKHVLPPPEEEIPQRFARAEEVFAGKLWREQLREWDETAKPAAIATHRELQAVDPDALSDDELEAYLRRCRDHHAAMITQHMRFTASAVVPTGDFLAHVGDWTGLPPAELLGLMRGASPVSAGASASSNGSSRRSAPTRPRRCCSRRTTTRRSARGAARARRRDGRGDDRLSRPRRQPAPRRVRHLRAVGARAARRAAARDPDRRRGASADGDDVEAAHRRGPRARFRRSTATSSTSCSARRGSCTGCATSAASTATSGRRGSCAELRSRAGRRLAARRTHPRAGALRRRRPRRDVRAARGRGRPTADELAARADVPPAAQREGRTRRHSGRPPPPPPTRPGCRPAVARLMRATGIALGALFGSSEAEHEERSAARARREPRRLRRERRVWSPAPQSSAGSSRATYS